MIYPLAWLHYGTKRTLIISWQFVSEQLSIKSQFCFLKKVLRSQKISCFDLPYCPLIFWGLLSLLWSQSIYRLSERVFRLFIIKGFYKKKKNCLSSDPENGWDVTGNYFFFLLALHSGALHEDRSRVFIGWKLFIKSRQGIYTSSSWIDSHSEETCL